MTDKKTVTADTGRPVRQTGTAPRPFHKQATMPSGIGGGRPVIGIICCAAQDPAAAPHLAALLQNVERGVAAGGGTPVALSLTGLAEGLAQGHEGQSYLFPRRGLLADEVECLARGAGLNGVALVADHNDAAAGLILGAVRLNIPAIYVPARGSSVAPAAEDAKKGAANGGGPADDYPRAALNMLAEIMGLGFPLSSTVPTGSADQLRLAQSAGQRLTDLVRQNFDMRRVLMPNAFMNAIRLDATMGGWPETVVFLMALAHELSVKVSVENFIDIGARTPQLCQLTGAKGQALGDFHNAGGVPAILRALKGQWQPHPTVSGRGINDIIKNAQIKDAHVIRVKTPYRKDGGLGVLRGNLAPKGAFFRWPANLSKKLLAFSGPARVFDSRDAALEALIQKKIKKGDVLVVRYEGPRGGNGFRPLSLIGHLLKSQKLDESVALVTDGRLGNPLDGLFIEMVSPEAFEASTLSVLREGDRINIDLNNRTLLVHLTDTDLKVRLARWQAPAPRSHNGFLWRYARSAGGVLEGAIFR